MFSGRRSAADWEMDLDPFNSRACYWLFSSSEHSVMTLSRKATSHSETLTSKFSLLRAVALLLKAELKKMSDAIQMSRGMFWTDLKK